MADEANDAGAKRDVNDATRIAWVRETLGLRTAVLGALAAGADAVSAERDVATLRASSVESWRLLLTAECCALPLAARLRTLGVASSLPAPIQSVLTEAQLAETQRVMAARSQLRELDALAAELGIEMIVLKGGAIAAESSRPPIDLGDVDLLVTPEGAALVWRRLVDGGWRMKSAGGIAATDDVPLDFNHFDPLIPPRDGIPVELHHRHRYVRGAANASDIETRALAGHCVLRRTIGAAAVVTALEHSVIQHPHRRGHLRDLVLLADAMGECAPAVREQLDVSSGDPRYAPELRDMLGQVRALERGERPVDPPSIRRAVARKYLGLLGDDRRLSARVPGWFELSHTALERGPLRRARYREMARAGLAPIPPGSTFAAKSLAARAPRLVGAAARVLRACYWVSVTGLMVATGPSLRRRVDSALRQA